MSLVEVVHEDAIAFLHLNRPDQRNALSIELCDAVADALGEVEDAARVVILGGNGKVFCSGADLAAVGGGGSGGETGGGIVFLPHFEAMLEAVARFRLPTIAQIHGAALGGGLQLATACDFRIVADEAKLGIPSTRLGVVVNLENVRRQVLLTGLAVAREVLMTGRTFTGVEAAAAGLANRSVPGPELDAATRAFAEGIVSLAPLSVQGAKRALQAVLNATGDPRVHDPDAAAEIDRLVREAYASEDLAEGIQAMRDKRPPRFTGA